MPFNGFGVFNRIYSWQADANAGIDISSSRMDTDTDDITTNGLGLCLTRDGQGSAQADLPMNGYVFTNLGTPTAAGQALVYGQSGLNFGGDVTAAFGTTGVELVGNAATQTDATTAAGTVAAAYASGIAAITFATGGNAITITDAYNLYCAAPVAGAHVTATNAWALGADSLRVNGNAQVNMLGIGMLPVNVLDITQNQNGAANISLLNNDGGTSAYARLQLSNGSHLGFIAQTGTGFNAPLFSGGPSTAEQFAAGTTANAPFIFGTNNTFAGMFGTDGSFLVGRTTNAGAGHIADSIGNVRDIPLNTQASGYTLLATDNGKAVFMNTTGNVTVPSAVFVDGKNVVIINLTLSPISIVQGSGLTMTFAATGATGSRTLANGGMATVYFYAQNGCIISGAGLT